MFLYIILVFSSFFFSALELFTKEVNKDYFKIIQKIYIFIVFILFTFNRDNSDYRTYVAIFEGKSYVAEKGYMFFIKVIEAINGNHNYVLLTLGILLVYVLFYLYKIKYEITFIFFYSIFSFIYDINQIRNTFCILFILIGIKLLQKNKKILYIIFNVLGILFQRIGYIYIIFFVLQKIKLKTYIKIIILLCIGGIMFTPILRKVILILFTDKALLYFRYKPKLGILVYYILIGIDILLLKLIVNKAPIEKDKILIKYILFQMIFLFTSSLHLEIIGRIWKNTLYIKWFYLLKELENKKNLIKLVVFLLLIFQQLILLGVGLLRSFNSTIDLFSQISNIKFYF